jgi:hypothetical protein
MPGVGDEQASRRFAFLLHPQGIEEVRVSFYTRKEGRWSETRNATWGRSHLPMTGKGSWMKIQVIRKGTRYSFIQDGHLVFEFEDTNKPLDAKPDDQGTLRTWLLPATDEQATYELRKLKFVALAPE